MKTRVRKKMRKNGNKVKKRANRKNRTTISAAALEKKGEYKNSSVSRSDNLSTSLLISSTSKKKGIKRVSFADDLIQTTSALKQPKLENGTLPATPRSASIKVSNAGGGEDKLIAEKLCVADVSNKGSKKMLSHERKKKLLVPRKTKEMLLSVSRKDRKAYIRKLLKERKPNFELSYNCKLLWEKLRSKKTSAEERKKCADEIYNMVKDKVKKLVYAHDTCRVIESLVTVGTTDIKKALFDELTPEIICMAKSKFARNIILKMLKFGGTAQREMVISAFSGHCVTLLRNSISARVLEAAYNEYAQALQRYNILIEFCSKEFHSLKMQGNTVRTLKEIIEEDPNRKTAVVSYLEQILKDVVEGPQLKLSLTHHLLDNFLQYCSPSQMSEMVDSLKTRLPEIVHTLDGARVALKCLWNAAAKDRKVMVKNFKGFVAKTCQDAYAHRVLIGILDAVDDTVLINKHILQELIKNIGDICNNEYGVRVMHHLIHPRNPRYFKKSMLALFMEGATNKHSKKEAKQRYTELFDYIKKPLSAYFAKNMESLLYNERTALLVLYTLERLTNTDLFDRDISIDDRRECYSAIAEICSREFIPCDTPKMHIIEHPRSHFVISNLLRGDRVFDGEFSSILVKTCNDQLASWVSCSRGCFILLLILENGSEETKAELKRIIPVSMVKRYNSAGARSLLQKLH